MCKFQFIDWILDFEDYFNYYEICDEEKVIFVYNKVDDDVVKWQDDIKIDQKYRGKSKIHSWQRMKIVLVGLWFPYDCYDILRCTILDYRFINSYEEDCIQKFISQLKAQDCHQRNYFYRTQVQISSEEIDLMVNNSKTI